jgi:hypothetical protein
MASEEDGEVLERAYVQPDPDFPLPRIMGYSLYNGGMECNDEDQLERYQSSNPFAFRSEWFWFNEEAEGGI